MKLSLKVDYEMSVLKWWLYYLVSFPFSLSSQKHMALSSLHPWPWRQLCHHLPWEVSGLGCVYFSLGDMIWAVRMDRDWICVAEKCASGAALTSSTHEPNTRAGSSCVLYLLPEFTTSVTCCSWKRAGMGTWVGKDIVYFIVHFILPFFLTSTGALNPETQIC